MSAVASVHAAAVPPPGTDPVRAGPAGRSTFAAELAGRLRAVGRAPAAGTSPATIPPRATPLTESQAASALSGAWRAQTGADPAPRTLSLLVAQWSHETAGGRSMVHFNFGGIKGQGPGGLSTACWTREGSGPSEARLLDRFRAYRTADEGAADYVRLLRSRFGGAVEAAEAGDPSGFVHALKQAGYFTGSEEAYTRSVERLVTRMEGSPEPVGVATNGSAPGGVCNWGRSPPAQPALAGGPWVGALALADELTLAALRSAADRAQDDDHGHGHLASL